ncbi:MAG: C40 family peptidase [Balneola sp.]
MQLLRKILLVILLPLTLFAGCTNSNNSDAVNTFISNIKSDLVPDSRVAMFDISVQSKNNILVLKGETTLPEAKQALLDSLRIKEINFADSIDVLPDVSVGENYFALVNNSASNLRSEPKHSAQLATQAIMGMPLKVLKKQGGWYLVQTPEDYLSWVDSGGIERMDEESYSDWAASEKVIYLDTYGFSYSKANRNSEKVSDLVAGSILKLKSGTGAYYNVEYPDGRIGFIHKSEARLLNDWESSISATHESLIETAKTMIGAPYLWGGTSTKGMDCSGFTKTIYFMNGQIIPRDASQQVKAGKLIDSDKDWDKLEVGDLLFFGREATDSRSRAVTHVGMWIGDNKFIHSASNVHISSVDPDSDIYDSFNTGRYLEARRYIDNWDGNIIPTNKMYTALADTE